MLEIYTVTRNIWLCEVFFACFGVCISNCFDLSCKHDLLRVHSQLTPFQVLPSFTVFFHFKTFKRNSSEFLAFILDKNNLPFRFYIDCEILSLNSRNSRIFLLFFLQDCCFLLILSYFFFSWTSRIMNLISLLFFLSSPQTFFQTGFRRNSQKNLPLRLLYIFLKKIWKMNAFRHSSLFPSCPPPPPPP